MYQNMLFAQGEEGARLAEEIDETGPDLWLDLWAGEYEAGLPDPDLADPRTLSTDQVERYLPNWREAASTGRFTLHVNERHGLVSMNRATA